MKKHQNFTRRMAKFCILCLVITMILPACGSVPSKTGKAEAKVKKTVTVSTSKTKTSAKAKKKSETSKEDASNQNWPKDFSLYQTYKNDFLVGNIYNDWNRNGADKQIILKQFNVLTPENLMKPEYMQPTEGKFNYKDSDTLLAFTKENNLKLHGHTLVWHGQSGNWLGINVSREKAIEQLKSHITNIVGHYKGQIYSWDVVNEAIDDGAVLKDGNWKACLRKSQWYNSIGPDFMELAFKFAHEADPSAKLYYNDYNMSVKNKVDIAYAMIKDFKSRGIPIDGVGLQSHESTESSMKAVEYSLKKFSSIKDLQISISELDVSVKDVPATGLTKDQEIQQGITYANLFKLYKKYSKNIDRVTFWGYADNKSWLGDKFPCLFNKDFSPKLAAYAVLDPDKFLNIYKKYVTVKKVSTATALHGTPKIDGEIDTLWKKCPAAQINNQVTAWQGAKGTVRLLWDDKFVYALFEVKDNVLNDSSQNLYEQDSVEMFLDQNNEKYNFYDDNDGQYRVNYKGKESFGTIPDVKGFKSAAKQTKDGYLIEVAVPLLKKAKAGKVMGFDAQINDSNDTGMRTSIMKYNDITDNSFGNTENWGNVKLVK